jgi:hypothetical protein
MGRSSKFSSKFTRVVGTGAAVFVLTAIALQGVALQGVARADQDVASKYFVPVPTIESRPIVSPYAAPKFEFGSVDTTKFRKEAPEVSFNSVDLGKSALRFDLADVVTTPAPGTPDLTNVIVPLPPGKKRATPRYFGFALTTPTY